MELNKDAVLQTFEKLKAFLEGVIPQTEDGNMLNKIGHDFILMLEEFTSEDEISFERFWSEGKRKGDAVDGWRSISEAVLDIGQLYGDAMDAIEAFRRIIEHRMAIKHVAQLIGYADLAYFYRVFKKHYGVTPGELRKED